MSTKKYKKVGKKCLFDAEFSKEDLSLLGNPLEKISAVIDFEMFRQTLEDGLLNKTKKTMQEPKDTM